ncbi:MAG: hypothetical protein U0414_30065 [Polyangiaceae bacterium]
MARLRRRSPNYKRPSRIKPRSGWAPLVVAGWLEISRRTLGVYMKKGLVQRPKYAGNATRLEAQHIAELVVARDLVGTKKLSLPNARKQMALLSTEAIVALAKQLVAPNTPLGDALGVKPPPPPPPAVPPGPPLGSERWDRLVLLPGFEVSLRSDAPDDLRLLVERIRATCARLLEARGAHAAGGEPGSRAPSGSPLEHL